MVRYGELDGAVVLVTGAGRGIGKGIALGFGQQRSVVVVNDVTEDVRRARRSMRSCRPADARRSPSRTSATPTPAVRSSPDVDRAPWPARRPRRERRASTRSRRSSTCRRRRGSACSARTSGRSSIAASRPPATWPSAAAARSSSSARPPANETYAEQTHYAAAKAGLQMLAFGMAWELGPLGVRTNVVHPGWIETELNREYLWSDPTLRERVVRQIRSDGRASPTMSPASSSGSAPTRRGTSTVPRSRSTAGSSSDASRRDVARGAGAAAPDAGHHEALPGHARAR